MRRGREREGGSWREREREGGKEQELKRKHTHIQHVSIHVYMCVYTNGGGSLSAAANPSKLIPVV